MTKYFEIIDNQGCWFTKYFTGAELKEYVNNLLEGEESTYRVRNIKEAIRELSSLEFTVNEVNATIYNENQETLSGRKYLDGGSEVNNDN